jgi:class 3 adenylate cyclase
MVVCASCGAENREGARFCDSCGAPLAEAAPAREVRKVVTVLFCDVTGSTALGEQIDPESLRRVMSRYFETAKAIVERHGGTVEKFIGDAVMAVFGVPAVHEDDALRAVRAADELRAPERGARKLLRDTPRAADRRQHRRGCHRNRGAPRDGRCRERRGAARAGG